jgi:hypothetical protein
MQLKLYLKKQITDSNVSLRREIDRNHVALRSLNKTGASGFTYLVYLQSLWSNEGEKSTTTIHQGSLDEAIIKAETDFKQVNKRTDVQAEYDIRVRLGKKDYSLPLEFWRKYRRVL